MEYLPLEVVAHIFSFLPNINDRKNASAVCRMWYQAYQDPVFRNKEVVLIANNEQIQCLMSLKNEDRKYFHIVFKEIDIGQQHLVLWEKFGDGFRSLFFNNCEMNEKTFIAIISQCQNLVTLKVQNCRDLFITGRFLRDNNTRLKVETSFRNLTTLNLGFNRYLSDAILSNFLTTAKNIHTLQLPGCQISYHSGLYKKFYPNSNCEEFVPSDCVLTFFVILKFLTDSSSKIKTLAFNETLIDSNALCNLSEIPNLQLESLSLRFCTQLTNVGIAKLCSMQKQLTVLDLSGCARITDLGLMEICSGLPNLEFLSVQRCKCLTDVSIKDIQKLNKLKKLNVSECDLIQGPGLLLALQGKAELTDLKMRGLVNIQERRLTEISQFLLNLKYLDVSFCVNAVSDSSIQSIIKHNTKLQVLICGLGTNLTDRGLTGMGLEDEDYQMLSKNPVISPTNPHRIPLGSAAEIEIVNDAAVRQSVLEFCETDFENSISIKNLKHLRELILSGCNKITDVSLKYCFKFSDLILLDLQNCQQITAEGLQFVALNNKSIENLNLQQCDNVSDTAVEYIVKNLKNLKYFIVGSKKITDVGANYIAEYGKNLRYLDIRHCPNVSAAVCCDIKQKLPNILMFHAAVREGDNVVYAP